MIIARRKRFFPIAKKPPSPIYARERIFIIYPQPEIRSHGDSNSGPERCRWKAQPLELESFGLNAY